MNVFVVKFDYIDSELKIDDVRVIGVYSTFEKAVDVVMENAKQAQLLERYRHLSIEDLLDCHDIGEMELDE